MATPFAAALFSDPHTMVCLILDLSTPTSLASLDARLAHIEQHGAAETPKLLVGSKSDLPRAIDFCEAAAAARLRGLPYVECCALGIPPEGSAVESMSEDEKDKVGMAEDARECNEVVGAEGGIWLWRDASVCGEWEPYEPKVNAKIEVTCQGYVALI